MLENIQGNYGQSPAVQTYQPTTSSAYMPTQQGYLAEVIEPSSSMQASSGSEAAGFVEVLPELVKAMFNGIIRLFDHMAKALTGQNCQAQTTALPVAPEAANPVATDAVASEDSSKGSIGSFVDTIGGLFKQGKSLLDGFTTSIKGQSEDGSLIGGIGNLVENIPGVGGLIGKGIKTVGKIFGF